MVIKRYEARDDDVTEEYGRDRLKSLQAQVKAQGEELEAGRRELQELHVLVQQAQATLPGPRENRHSWWRFWQS